MKLNKKLQKTYLTRATRSSTIISDHHVDKNTVVAACLKQKTIFFLRTIVIIGHFKDPTQSNL